MRLRPRFSLRTLFVLVTIAGCWAGYQINWIRQRHNFRDRHAAIELSKAPWSLRPFGESGVKSFIVQMPSEFDEAQGLFPEADAYYW